MLNHPLLVLGTLCLIGATTSASLAQSEPPANSTATVETTSSNQQPLPDPATADLVIQGSVTAESVKYDQVPKTKIRFFGTPNRITGWQTERRNIPKDVKPGVTYRDVGVKFRIISVFENLDEMLSDPTSLDNRLAPVPGRSP